MKPSAIEIYTNAPERPFQMVRHIKVQISAGMGIFGKTPTFEDANQQLRDQAARFGANAVINVNYGRGISAFSWNALNAEGDAVILESDEKKCPYCAEMIKREAKICRFCGRDQPS
jgi:hypothetical protein